MSLTQEDLQQIRSVVRDEVSSQLVPVHKKIDDLAGTVEALSNDIKEIYGMIAELQRGTVTDASFQKLSLEQKLLRLHAEVVAAAKQAGVTLPQ